MEEVKESHSSKFMHALGHSLFLLVARYARQEHVR
jgi:hypothetical protein